MIEGEYDGYVYKIGQCQNENDFLVKTAGQDDVWIHIDKLPSAHGLVFRGDNRDVSKGVILHVCSIIAEKTKYGNKVKFIWTRRRNLVRTKEPGKVIVKKVEGTI